jgi:lysozyme
MKTSETAKACIAEWEGVKLQVYRCPAGKLTTGVGHVVLDSEKDLLTKTLTREEAMDIFTKDLESFEFYVEKHFKDVKLSQAQFDAAVSFCFNAGPGNMRKSQWARLLISGNVEKAAEAMANWGQKQFKAMPGLKKRRFAESMWLRRGIQK